MPRVHLYTTAICPYCVRAKALLSRKGVDYDEVRIEGDRGLIREMIERSGRRTVPQIFIDDFHVGGYDDLAELDAFGKLDELLGMESVGPVAAPGAEDASERPAIAGDAPRQMVVGRPLLQDTPARGGGDQRRQGAPQRATGQTR